MKRFLKETLLYTFLFGIFSFSLSGIIYFFSEDKPHYYNQYEVCLLGDKLSILKNSTHPYNTLFFGTSKTFRHINPSVYDSMTEGARSFNAGISNLYPFRMHDFIREIAGGSHAKYKTIVIELSPLAQIGSNYDKNPNIYAINAERFAMALKYPFQNGYNLKSKILYITGYSKLFFYKYAGFGIAKRLRLIADIAAPEFQNDCIGTDLRSRNGYYSLDEQLKERTGSDWEKLKRRNMEFINKFAANVSLLEDRYRVPSNDILAIPYTHVEDDFTKSLRTLIHTLEAVTERIVFVIPPRTDLKDLCYLQKQKFLLENEGYAVLDFSNPENFPELYQMPYSFDGSHLNEKGAMHYSALVARGIENVPVLNKPLKAFKAE